MIVVASIWLNNTQAYGTHCSQCNIHEQSGGPYFPRESFRRNGNSFDENSSDPLGRLHPAKCSINSLNKQSRDHFSFAASIHDGEQWLPLLRRRGWDGKRWKFTATTAVLMHSLTAHAVRRCCFEPLIATRSWKCTSCPGSRSYR